MLAERAKDAAPKPGPVPHGEGWALEIKWDGCRAQLRYDGRSVGLRTPKGRECSADFPELAEIADVLGKRRVTLDGELVCLRSDGQPDFARLRRRLVGSTVPLYPAMLQVFDLLPLDRRSTRELPYRDRRALLAELPLDGPAWRTPASIVVDEPDEFVSRVAALRMEGVLAKRLDATYAPGRGPPRGSSTNCAARSSSRSPARAARATGGLRRCSSPVGVPTGRLAVLDRSSSGLARS